MFALGLVGLLCSVARGGCTPGEFKATKSGFNGLS